MFCKPLVFLAVLAPSLGGAYPLNYPELLDATAAALQKRITFPWGKAASFAEYEPKVQEAINAIFSKTKDGKVVTIINPDIGALKFLRDAAKASAKGLDEEAVNLQALGRDFLNEWEGQMKRVIAQGNKLDAATAQLSLDKYNALKTSTKVKEILKQGAIVATGGAVGVAGVEGAIQAAKSSNSDSTKAATDQTSSKHKRDDRPLQKAARNAHAIAAEQTWASAPGRHFARQIASSISFRDRVESLIASVGGVFGLDVYLHSHDDGLDTLGEIVAISTLDGAHAMNDDRLQAKQTATSFLDNFESWCRQVVAQGGSEQKVRHQQDLDSLELLRVQFAGPEGGIGDAELESLD